MIQSRWPFVRVEHGGLIPSRWLGYAWYEHVTDRAVYLPIPLNWLARWARNTWLFLRFPDPSEWDRRAMQIVWDVKAWENAVVFVDPGEAARIAWEAEVAEKTGVL